MLNDKVFPLSFPFVDVSDKLLLLSFYTYFIKFCLDDTKLLNFICSTAKYYGALSLQLTEMDDRK